MNERETGNQHAGEEVTDLAKRIHEGSQFKDTPWDDVDPVMRERRIAQAHDLVTLGYVQKINEYYPVEHIAPGVGNDEKPVTDIDDEPDYIGDEERLR